MGIMSNKVGFAWFMLSTKVAIKNKVLYDQNFLWQNTLIFQFSHLPNTTLLFVDHLIYLPFYLNDIKHFDGGFDGSGCLIGIQPARFEIPSLVPGNQGFYQRICFSTRWNGNGIIDQ